MPSQNKLLSIPGGSRLWLPPPFTRGEIMDTNASANAKVFAYRCPKCGGGVLTPMIDPMKLRGMVRLGCPCGKSRMTVEHEPDHIALTVPCLLCGREHHFKVDPVLLSDEGFHTLNCPYSDMTVFWSGEINEVKADLAKTELDLLNLLGDERELDSFGKLHPDEDASENAPGDDREIESVMQKMTGDRWYDPDIVSAVKLVISELKEDGKIFCKCPSNEGIEYEIGMTKEGFLVKCPVCGASRMISVDPGPASQAFLDADHLTLE